MNSRRVAVATIVGGMLTCLAGAATASPLVCTVPTSTTLNVLPSGCMAILTNGPVTYTGVLAGNGDIHNVSVASLTMFNMNIALSLAQSLMTATDHDITANTTTSINGFSPNVFFETTPDNNGYLPNSGTHTFPIIHFINSYGNGVVLKLNFGEAGRPSQGQLDMVSSSADTTTSPGNFTISSFFDVFTELSLDGGLHWTVADNDFIPGSNNPGTGTTLQLVNAVPEPGTLTLTVVGFTGLWKRYRRRRR